MDILILGAGQVGSSLAESLLHENYNITLVDTDAAQLASLQNRLDIRTICGHGSYPDVLRRAGGEKADMLIAVTSSDETNIVACQVAQHLFHTPTKIARIRANNYTLSEEMINKDKPGFSIDVCISPEELMRDHIRRLIDYPGAAEVLDFADGKVQLLAVKPYYGGPMVGKTIKDLHQVLANIPLQAVALFRRERSIPINQSTLLEVDDYIYFITSPHFTYKILQLLGRYDKPHKRVTIAGGGHIGCLMAKHLENNFQVKIIDQCVERTQFLAESLDKSMVLHGNAVDRELLLSENIEQCDVFCAVTNDDEANIMSCLQAKRLGAANTIAIINRRAYTELIENSGIDHAICPQESTISAILTHLRRGDVVKMHKTRQGGMEAIEIVAHGDESCSKVVERKLGDINLPKGTIVGAIVRDGSMIIPNSETMIKENDHIILMIMNKESVEEVERLFQVNVGFFG